MIWREWLTLVTNFNPIPRRNMMIILAIDLGKFNSMCCFFNAATQEHRFHLPRIQLCAFASWREALHRQWHAKPRRRKEKLVGTVFDAVCLARTDPAVQVRIARQRTSATETTRGLLSTSTALTSTPARQKGPLPTAIAIASTSIAGRRPRRQRRRKGATHSP